MNFDQLCINGKIIFTVNDLTGHNHYRTILNDIKELLKTSSSLQYYEKEEIFEEHFNKKNRNYVSSIFLTNLKLKKTHDFIRNSKGEHPEMYEIDYSICQHDFLDLHMQYNQFHIFTSYLLNFFKIVEQAVEKYKDKLASGEWEILKKYDYNEIQPTEEFDKRKKIKIKIPRVQDEHEPHYRFSFLENFNLELVKINEVIPNKLSNLAFSFQHALRSKISTEVIYQTTLKDMRSIIRLTPLVSNYLKVSSCYDFLNLKKDAIMHTSELQVIMDLEYALLSTILEYTDDNTKSSCYFKKLAKENLD